MNELMQKIAEKLSVNVDKTPEVYEALKGQYLVYEVYNYIIWFICFCLVICFCCCLFSFLAACMVGWDDYGLQFAITFLTFIILIVVYILVIKYRNAHAPDIVFLKGILGGC